MWESGPKGPSAEDLVKQQEAARAIAEAETAKIEAERKLENVMADNKAMADQSAKGQRTLLGGLFDEEDDEDTLPDDTVAPSVTEKPRSKKKKTAALLAE